MENYYNEISTAYDELHLEEQSKKLSIIKSHWNPKGLILDIGCGTNIASKFFNNIIGIDNSFSMLRQGINVCAKAESLPFKTKSFDAILCLTAIHNFNDHKKAIKEMKRILKKDCIAISILKKSSKFNEIKKEILKKFNCRIFEDEKDVIFICP